MLPKRESLHLSGSSGCERTRGVSAAPGSAHISVEPHLTLHSSALHNRLKEVIAVEQDRFSKERTRSQDSRMNGVWLKLGGTLQVGTLQVTKKLKLGLACDRRWCKCAVCVCLLND